VTDHSIELALRGLDPTVRPPMLTGEDVAYAVDDTPLGRMLFAVTAKGAVLASRYITGDDAEDVLLQRISDRVSPRVLRSPRRTDDVRRQLDEYLAGSRHAFDVRTDTALMADFQRRVLTRLPEVAGYGQVTSYGALATAAGNPKAARAVGAALGANPLCVVLPCHRVVGAAGALTGYAGGVAAKRRLLELESAATQ
jgi:methylated-DNA-[protein]-cysteine S-methyltransferase